MSRQPVRAQSSTLHCADPGPCCWPLATKQRTKDQNKTSGCTLITIHVPTNGTDACQCVRAPRWKWGLPGRPPVSRPRSHAGRGWATPGSCALPSDRGRVPDARHVVSEPGRSGPILQGHPQKSKTHVHLSNDLERRPLKGRPNRPRGYPSVAELLH